MKIKALNIILISLIFFSCSDQGLPAGARTGGFKLADPVQHRTVIELMELNNIPYEINERGRVVYLVNDIAKVLGIKRKVLYGDILNERDFEGMAVINEGVKKRYEAAFREQNIYYDISDYGELIQFSWSQKYGPKVDVIRQKVEMEIAEEQLKVKVN